jgi:two-component system chemotaxis response regulator CheB
MTAPSSSSPDAAYDLLVIGGSAGSLGPMTTILSMLEPSFPAAVAVILHRAPEARSVLARILGRSGPLEAAEAVEGSRLERGRILVAPPDRHLLIEAGGRLSFRSGQIHYVDSAIDPVLESAAEAYGNRVLAVILSGGGEDGTAGCRAVQEAGGVVLVQDPASAGTTRMLESVIQAGVTDRVMPVEDIPPLIRRLLREGRAALDRRD